MGSRLWTQPLPGPPTVSLSFPWFWGAAHGDPGCQPRRSPTAPEAFVEAATAPHPHPAALPLGPGAQRVVYAPEVLALVAQLLPPPVGGRAEPD